MLACVAATIAFLALGGTGMARPVECPGMAPGRVIRVRPKQLHRQFKQLRKVFQRKGLHILDLPRATWSQRQALADAKLATDWCAVDAAHKELRRALDEVQVDEAFVSEKLARVKRWVEATANREGTNPRIERRLANAEGQVAQNRLTRANGALTRLLELLFGGDLLTLPDPLPPIAEDSEDDDADQVAVDPGEVRDGCPRLADQGSASVDELRQTLRKLGTVLDQRTVRLIDVDEGEVLAKRLREQLALEARWAAACIACALTARARKTEIGLGTVTDRFRWIRAKRYSGEVPKGQEQRFIELVRQATAHLAEKRYGEAHRALETLLVLLGRPPSPSQALPAF